MSDVSRAALFRSRWFVVLGACAVVTAVGMGASVLFGGGLPGSQWLPAVLDTLRRVQAADPLLFGVGYFAVLTLAAALSVPGSSVLALAAGLCFGTFGGTLIVAGGSACGATLAFLAARHLWRDRVRRRFGERLAAIESGIARNGAVYLLGLRLVPLVPFVAVNLAMGLSPMPAARFFTVSLAGLTVGSAAYVQAGTAIAAAGGLAARPSPLVLAAFGGLVLLVGLVIACDRLRRRPAPASATLDAERCADALL